VSVATGGGQANGYSWSPAISADGRYVAFGSAADNLVVGDNNSVSDIFVRDRQAGITTRVSVASAGTEANAAATSPAISADGRYVAFESRATNLISVSVYAYAQQIFIHDRQSATTELVSIGVDGNPGWGTSYLPTLSADGRFVAFESGAYNLIHGNTTSQQIFVRDRETATTSVVSVATGGAHGNNFSRRAAISADGRYVTFRSAASNLVTGDTNFFDDIFVHDRQSATTTRVSLHSNGTQGNNGSEKTSISADGRYVAFSSWSTNLISGGTTNGQIFVHDRQNATTRLASVPSSGSQGYSSSYLPDISADGRVVAFHTYDSVDGRGDIFVHELSDVALVTHSISGRVTDGSGGGMPSVTLSDGTRTTTSDALGNYTLSGVPVGTYLLTASRIGYNFAPANHVAVVNGPLSGYDFTVGAATFSISGRVTTSTGSGLAGVLISDETRSATSDSNGNYTLSGVPAGNYTLTPTLSGYTFSPASLSVAVSGNLTGQNFIASTPAVRTFQVDRDGLSFANFSYYGSSWENFKKTFPATQMELPSGERRKGPEAYFRSMNYAGIGEGGNCAGFTAVSLIRFLNLSETVEPSLLSAANRTTTPPFAWQDFFASPLADRDINTGQSDLADYIHLYQARQASARFVYWWNQEGHHNDTPQQTFTSITQYLQNGEPVAVTVRQPGEGGHRMTAYRTEQVGNTGYIYVYDNNWPNDANRRITVNLQSGQWSYELAPDWVWGGTSNLYFSPGSLNFPAALFGLYDHNNPNAAQLASDQGTQLMIEGDAEVQISDAQGRILTANAISAIPGASYMPIFAFNLNDPDAPERGVFYLPSTLDYTVTIASAASGSYTLTAVANNSLLNLNNVSASAGVSDTLYINGDVRQAQFTPASDNAYCHYLTEELTNASRGYTSCVEAEPGTTLQFTLDGSSGLTINNTSNRPVSVDATLDQVGEAAQTVTRNETIAPGTSVTVTPALRATVYLPLVRR
ncbi:MAG: hypothetical protein EI684_04250, partial [Candidatus Viridilinea halotolerans]